MDERRTSRAEGNLIVGPPGASEGAGLVVLGVAVRIRASVLKEPGVVGRPAAPGGAAILVSLEDGARVVATARSLEHVGALPDDVGRAPDPPAAARGRAEVHRHVEAVNEGDVDEVEVLELVEGELGEGVGRGAIGRAGEFTAAVTGLAMPVAVAVERTAGAGPDTATGGAGVDVDGPGLAAVEPPATTGDRGGPDGVGAVVDDVEGGSVGEGEEEEGEEEEERE